MRLKFELYDYWIIELYILYIKLYINFINIIH